MITVKKVLSVKQVYLGFLGVSLVAIIYYLLVIGGLIDYKYAWGGRLSSPDQVLKYGLISIVIQLFFILIITVRKKQIESNRQSLLIKGLVGVIASFLFLNTIGNLYAKEIMEKTLFSPLALLGCLCSLRLVITSDQDLK